MRFPKRVPVIISKKYVFAFFSFFLSLHTTLLTFVWLTVVLDLFCISFNNAASLYLTQFGLTTYKQPSCKTVFLSFLKCYEHTTFKLCKTIQIIQPNFNATNNSDFMQTDGKKVKKVIHCFSCSTSKLLFSCFTSNIIIITIIIWTVYLSKLFQD